MLCGKLVLNVPSLEYVPLMLGRGLLPLLGADAVALQVDELGQESDHETPPIVVAGGSFVSPAVCNRGSASPTAAERVSTERESPEVGKTAEVDDAVALAEAVFPDTQDLAEKKKKINFVDKYSWAISLGCR